MLLCTEVWAGTELCFVSPNVRKAPNIILVHCVKGGGRQLRILDPLYIYKEDGTYTDELRKCYDETK